MCCVGKALKERIIYCCFGMLNVSEITIINRLMMILISLTTSRGMRWGWEMKVLLYM